MKAYKIAYFSVNYQKEDDYRDKFFVYSSSFSLQLLEVSQIAYSETFTASTDQERQSIVWIGGATDERRRRHELIWGFSLRMLRPESFEI